MDAVKETICVDEVSLDESTDEVYSAASSVDEIHGCLT